MFCKFLLVLLGINLTQIFASTIEDQTPTVVEQISKGLKSKYPIFLVRSSSEFSYSQGDLLQVADAIDAYRAVSVDFSHIDHGFKHSTQKESIRALWKQHESNPDYFNKNNILSAYTSLESARCLMPVALFQDTVETQFLCSIVLSSKRMYTHLHNDPRDLGLKKYKYSWMHLLKGKKHWFFVHSDDIEKKVQSRQISSYTDLRELSIEKLREFFVGCLTYECILNAGDLIVFDAENWFHAVRTEEASLGCGGESFALLRL